MTNIRSRSAVVFDFDGTLTPKKTGSLFSVVDAAALSPAANAEMQRLRTLYLGRAVNGTLTIEEETSWLEETLVAYIKDGLTQDRVRESLRGVVLRPGVVECLEWLWRFGVPVAIVSYGATPFIEEVLEQNGTRSYIDRIFSATMEVSPESARFHSYDRASFVLPVDKGGWSRWFATTHGVLHENLIAVGDSGGDKYLGHLKERRLGIAKDDADAAKIAQFMGEVIVTEDFAPVTDWLRRTLNRT